MESMFDKTPDKRVDDITIAASAVINYILGLFYIYYKWPDVAYSFGWKLILVPFVSIWIMMPFVFIPVYILTYPLRWILRHRAKEEKDGPEL